VEVFASGDGLWIGRDLLAAASGLAEGKSVGEAAPDSAFQTAPRRPARLVADGGRQLLDPGCFWGQKTGPNPTDRRKAGSKHHLLTDAQGLPLSAILTGANRHDITQLLPLVKALPAVRGKVGRPQRRPARLYGDRAYDSQPHRRVLQRSGIRTSLARRRTEHGSGLGKFRWVVERTFAWLHRFRRLQIRYERRADIHTAFLTLGCALICWKVFTHGF